MQSKSVPLNGVVHEAENELEPAIFAGGVGLGETLFEHARMSLSRSVQVLLSAIRPAANRLDQCK